MAVIERLPPKGIIRGYRGVLDFYVNKNRVIARRWPNKPRLPRAPNVQQPLRWSRLLDNINRQHEPCVRRVLEAMTESTGWTWKDLTYRLFFGTDVDYETFYQHVWPDYNVDSWEKPHVGHISIPDPYNRIFAVHAIRPVMGGTGGWVRFYISAPSAVQMLHSTSPPRLMPVMKKVRGQTIECGISWQWPPGTVRHFPHPLVSGPRTPTFWGTRLLGHTLWWVQLVPARHMSDPHTISFGPVIMLYHPPIAIFMPNRPYVVIPHRRYFADPPLLPLPVPLAPPYLENCGMEALTPW